MAVSEFASISDRRLERLLNPNLNDGPPAVLPTPPPLLGEHSSEILTEAGYDEAAIARLIELGVV